jgi:hypothetical protein
MNRLKRSQTAATPGTATAMDSQHRHELQQNDLGKLTNKAVPFFEKHGLQIAGGIAALAIAFGIGVYWYQSSTASTAESWVQFDRVLHQPSSSAGDFAAIAEKHPGSSVAAWSRLKEADDFLKSGLQLAFSNRESSQSNLKSAQEAYQKLAAGGPGIIPEVKERALFGLARCLETVSDGSGDEAVQTYARLLKEFPDSIFASIVNERIKALETTQSKDFYAWFQQQKPEPKDPLDIPVRKSPHNFSLPGEGEKDTEKSSGDDAQETSESSGESKPDGDDVPNAEQPENDKPESDAKPPEESKSDKSESP